MQIGTKWYGWIPTNLGKINFNFIDESNLYKITKKFDFQRENNIVIISNLKLNFISDTSFFSKILNFFKFKEIIPVANIKIINRNDKILYGNIELIYPKSIYFDIKFIFSERGKVLFKLINIRNYDNIDISGIAYEIKQIVYVVLKLIIHGDSHHHQKIDTALKIVENKFDADKIINDMLLHIKTIEKNIKMLNLDCSTRLKQNVSLDEVKGYISYINTFSLIFEINNIKLKIADNIFKSLEALLDKREKRYNIKESFKVTFFTFIGFIIATNILINSFCDTSSLKNFFQNYNRLELFGYSVIFWVIVYFKFIWCNFKGWLYYEYYKIYRFFVALIDIIKYILYPIGIIILIVSLLFISIVIFEYLKINY